MATKKRFNQKNIDLLRRGKAVLVNPDSTNPRLSFAEIMLVLSEAFDNEENSRQVYADYKYYYKQPYSANDIVCSDWSTDVGNRKRLKYSDFFLQIKELHEISYELW